MHGVIKKHLMKLFNCWEEFLQTQDVHSHVTDRFDKMQNVIQSQEQLDNQPLEPQSETREERMILSDLRTLFKSSEQSSNTTHDWHQAR